MFICFFLRDGFSSRPQSENPCTVHSMSTLLANQLFFFILPNFTHRISATSTVTFTFRRRCLLYIALSEGEILPQSISPVTLKFAHLTHFEFQNKATAPVNVEDGFSCKYSTGLYFEGGSPFSPYTL